MEEHYLYVRPRCSTDILTQDPDLATEWVEIGYDVYRISEESIRIAVDNEAIERTEIRAPSEVA